MSERNARVIEQAFEILAKNRVTVGEHTFTTPSLDAAIGYQGKQWLWDSCFHAMVLAEREPEMAKSELRALFAHQRQDGFVPHMNYFQGDAQTSTQKDVPAAATFLDSVGGGGLTAVQREQFLKGLWLHETHSDITQPPIIARAVEDVFRVTHDESFLREMLPKLRAYYDYLHDQRDPDGNDLISIIHPWESGWDNSPRWDEAIGVTQSDHAHISERKMEVFLKHKLVSWDERRVFALDAFNIEPVDFNVLYAQNMESLSRLCAAVDDVGGVKRYADRAKATGQAIFEKMWDGDKYCDLIGKSHRRSQVKSAAMFYPMMLVGEPHGRELVEKHLGNPAEFNVVFAVPTTSVDHPRFRGGQYWRGNVWLNVNTFVWEGLEKHLQKDPDFVLVRALAEKIKESTFALLDRSGFSEYFDPHTGEGHGAKSFGWNGIVRLMEPSYH